VRYGVSAVLLAALGVVSGCSDGEPEPPPVAITPTPTVTASYDGNLEPAAAVLALVPDEAQTLTVTDFDQVRKQLGQDELGDQSPAAEVAAFWQRAETELPLLTTGLLRPADAQLATTDGFTELDVAWEAHFSGTDGRELGWVLRFRDGTDMARVERAAEDPAGPVAGAHVDAAAHLASSSATDDPAQSWAADPQLVSLVGPAAVSTYVARDCDAAADTGSEEVDELGAYAVQFEGSLVTARLGEGRQDLFTRMRLGEDDPAFAAAYDGGVADPVTGRIGYEMTDPTAAAQLALARRLPFATCG
jgi:hypothetical protein